MRALFISQEKFAMSHKKICKTSNESKKPTNASLVNNAIFHIFAQVRYELNGVEIDRSKRVELTSTMEGWVSHNPTQTEFLQNAGWIDLLETKTFVNENGQLDVNISPKMILGFTEDYEKIIINCTHELVLIRVTSVMVLSFRLLLLRRSKLNLQISNR